MTTGRLRLTPASGDAAALTTITLVSIAQSLPPLLNAAGTQSDAAVVGLQAMHALRGESAWFLWGSGYQTSVDVSVATAFFRCFGATPLALMLSAFTGYLLLTGFAYATLRRRFDPWSSALLVAPLAIMAPPVHIYAFYPPRQASLTLLFAALWMLDGATRARVPGGRLAAGACLAGLACFADPYCLLFVPAVALFVVLLSADEGGFRRGRLAAGVAGLGVGLVPFWLLSHSAGARHGVYQFSTASLARHFQLLVHECLPYLLGTRVRRFVPGIGSTWWHPPGWFRAIELAGAASLAAAIVVGGALAFDRRIPGRARRLGALGALMLPVTLAAFVVSVMAMDRLSARYLVAIVLVSPFALAPVLAATSRGTLAVMLAPYLVSTAVGGWLGYGDNVDGPRIRFENGEARDERALGNVLRARGVHHGLADYWVAYRLTFLLHEDPILVPWHAALDRYPPYRRAVEAEPVVAYVFDPVWSVEDLAYRKGEFRSGKAGFEPDFEELRVGRYTLLILRRSSDRLRVADAPTSNAIPVLTRAGPATTIPRGGT